MHISTLLLALLPLSPSLAARLRVTIPSSTLLPNPSILPPTTSATLTTLGSVISAPLRLDNTFDFRNVSSGSYLLDVHCHTFAFKPLRVDVHSGAEEKVEIWGTFRGNEWSNRGEVVEVKTAAGVWEFEVRVAQAKEYFLERSGCKYCRDFPNMRDMLLTCDGILVSPLSILKNPMILIALVSMGVVFGMPYLMDNSKLPTSSACI
jgi:hypothetical protein